MQDRRKVQCFADVDMVEAVVIGIVVGGLTVAVLTAIARVVMGVIALAAGT